MALISRRFLACLYLILLNLPFTSISLASLATLPSFGHNSFDPYFRNPQGPIASNSRAVIRLRYLSPAQTRLVQIHLFDQKSKLTRLLAMERVADFCKTNTEALWQIELPAPVSPTVLEYSFEITGPDGPRYAMAHDGRFLTGGQSELASKLDARRTFKISIYNSTNTVPEWLKGAVIYQVFPDRFRNGDLNNDPVDGAGWIYGEHAVKHRWTDPVCPKGQTDCGGAASRIFYGGDLAGVIAKLDEIRKLGVTVLYLNPIFQAPSNHKYDTQNYLKIDPALGDEKTFLQLIAQAKARGIRVLLDGVFNHTSSDSPYFDYYDHWAKSGACTDRNSYYHDWYFLPAFAHPAQNQNGQAKCPPNLGAAGETYESWWGYPSIPKLNSRNLDLRGFFFNDGVGAVGPNWISKGASGWRLDVAGEVDAGQISDPSNGFWQGFHAAIRKVNSEAALLGENWGDARDWLISGEWDSVMNYRFRSAALSWMFDSCLGLGCENGQIFRDQNDNENNLSGAIHTLSESDFSLRLKAIAEAYPFDNWLAAMNLLGSHDTSRILFLLKKSSGDSAEIALRKLKFLALFQFTYPGAPAIYYGDEVGLAPDDIWDGQIWQGDPANRAPYPWRDQGGTPDEDLARHFARLARIHNSQPALVKGHYQTWLVDDQKRIFAFERSLAGAKTVRVVLNRSLGEQNLSIPVAPTLEGMEFVDLLSGKTFVAHNQKLDLGAIAGLWGMILLPAKTDALIGK